MKEASYPSADVSVYLDDAKLTFDQDPVLVHNTTMVPMRDVFEALGASIKWDATSQTVTGTKGDTEIKITIGSQTAYINGSGVSLTEAAIVVEGRTMVPLRFVSESLGANVKWDSTTRTIRITTVDE